MYQKTTYHGEPLKETGVEKVSEVSDKLLENMQGGPIKMVQKRYKTLVKRLDRVLLGCLDDS